MKPMDETAPDKEFGRLLRQWRRTSDIKQSRLADILGVTQATVSRWESGAQSPAPLQYDLIHQMMTRKRNFRLDHAVKRLVMHSSQRVHLIEDRSHRLLCASRPRENEWQRDCTPLLGTSLWRFATPEIASAEKSLHDLGWHEDQTDHLTFETSRRDGDPMRIIDTYILWERFFLSDGTAVRLTTGFDQKPAHI
ncbi:XRE family transcriptional regulator [Thalassospira tepidiphila]|jgi:transcriptional regulator with XRE-family HTH domain|uniref:helix-turn-helix domain-containing protein n=1 Tax=Thalassospira TaxID=168934 RepID=UPI000BC92304|nr:MULTISPECIES: helix-turn-helix transcriptional regulator [Thalassospira]MBS8275456.1 XRE family transcriptional regulator [Thalassospira tepidiphila]PCJ22610.1 MAG: transcriptional regulator [Rickettsiales bacterium]|tara:strand:+ start:15975 stop:16556 length:582 start_codon:yes stop_codon:yes gene_type:complete